MKKVLIFLYVLLLTAPFTSLMAQCPDPTGQKPLWVSGRLPKDTDVSYFRVIFVNGRTLEEARNKARQEVLMRRGGATAITADVWSSSENSSFHSQDNLTIRYDVICDYYTQRRDGAYNFWQLVQIARNPTVELPPVQPGYFRKLQGAERSALGLKPFVPGMAQIHKGSNVKGALFIISEAALIGGIVTTEVFRADNESKINTTYNVAQRQSYIDNANSLQNARNIFIVGAAAVYVWNIIDGFAANSSDRNNFAQTPDSDFKITPYVDSQSGTGGLTLTLNF